MNMIIHDMEGDIQIGDTFRRPQFRNGGRLRTFDRVVANPMWNQTEFKESDYDADDLDRFPSGAGFPGGKADWGWMQHILASLKPEGRAAVVLDTGAVTRGSGSGRSSKEREVRKWFVEQNLIDGVIYLPDDLFYNTSAPGVIIVLNRAKRPEHNGSIFMVNASTEFTKGDPKNFLSDAAVDRIASTFVSRAESDRFSRMISSDEIAASDFNLSPSRYIQAGVNVTHRPLDEIVSDLRALEAEAKTIDTELRQQLAELGI